MRKGIIVLMTLFLSTLFFNGFVVKSVFAEVIGDVDGDGRVGLTEAVYALQVSAGLIRQPGTEQVKNTADVLNYTVEALADSRNFMDGTEMIATIVDNTCIGDALSAAGSDDAWAVLSNCNFSDCGTYTYEISPPGIELTYEFSGTDACGGISGTLTVAAIFDSENNQIVLTADFDNLTGPEYSLDGSATITGDVSGDILTFHIAADSLDMCGSTLNGTLDATYNITTLQMQSVTVNGVSRYYDTEAGIWINVELLNIIYTADNLINGSAAVTFETDPSKTFSITFTNVVLDPTCTIPTDGTMVIDGGITFDFSETTCDDPTVIVMIGNFPVKMSLEDALNYISNL